MKKFDITVDGQDVIKHENSALKFLSNVLKNRHRMLAFQGNFLYLQTIDTENCEFMLTTSRGRALESYNSPVTPHMMHWIMFISSKNLHIERNNWSISIDGSIVDCQPYHIGRFIDVALA